jgi:hypothetical protein
MTKAFEPGSTVVIWPGVVANQYTAPGVNPDRPEATAPEPATLAVFPLMPETTPMGGRADALPASARATVIDDVR